MNNGKNIVKEINVADAHPAGNRPFGREEYINKFKTLTDGIISKKETTRFLNAVQDLKNLKSGELQKLNIEMIPQKKNKNKGKKAIF